MLCLPTAFCDHQAFRDTNTTATTITTAASVQRGPRGRDIPTAGAVGKGCTKAEAKAKSRGLGRCASPEGCRQCRLGLASQVTGPAWLAGWRGPETGKTRGRT